MKDCFYVFALFCLLVSEMFFDCRIIRAETWPEIPRNNSADPALKPLLDLMNRTPGCENGICGGACALTHCINNKPDLIPGTMNSSEIAKKIIIGLAGGTKANLPEKVQLRDGRVLSTQTSEAFAHIAIETQKMAAEMYIRCSSQTDRKKQYKSLDELKTALATKASLAVEVYGPNPIPPHKIMWHVVTIRIDSAGNLCVDDPSNISRDCLPFSFENGVLSYSYKSSRGEPRNTRYTKVTDFGATLAECLKLEAARGSGIPSPRGDDGSYPHAYGGSDGSRPSASTDGGSHAR